MNIDPEKHESCNCRICNLERELNASQAEVERLWETNAKLENCLRRIIDAPVFDPAKLIDFSMKLLWDSIAEAKATLNPDNKWQ